MIKICNEPTDHGLQLIISPSLYPLSEEMQAIPNPILEALHSLFGQHCATDQRMLGGHSQQTRTFDVIIPDGLPKYD